MWAVLLASGVDPIVAGLLHPGCRRRRTRPHAATWGRRRSSSRLSREQPTSELARSASVGLASTLSPNGAAADVARSVDEAHPIVPSCSPWPTPVSSSTGALLRHAQAQLRAKLGIVIGYVVGHNRVVVFLVIWAVTRLSRRNWISGVFVAQPVVLGSRTHRSGIWVLTSAWGIAERAFLGVEARRGEAVVLSAALISSLFTWLVYRLRATLSRARRGGRIGDARLI